MSDIDLPRTAALLFTLAVALLALSFLLFWATAVLKKKVEKAEALRLQKDSDILQGPSDEQVRHQKQVDKLNASMDSAQAEARAKARREHAVQLEAQITHYEMWITWLEAQRGRQLEGLRGLKSVMNPEWSVVYKKVGGQSELAFRSVRPWWVNVGFAPRDTDSQYNELRHGHPWDPLKEKDLDRPVAAFAVGNPEVRDWEHDVVSACRALATPVPGTTFLPLLELDRPADLPNVPVRGSLAVTEVLEIRVDITPGQVDVDPLSCPLSMQDYREGREGSAVSAVNREFDSLVVELNALISRIRGILSGELGGLGNLRAHGLPLPQDLA